MISTPTIAPIEALEQRLSPLRRQLAEHPLYAGVHTLDHVRVFMQSHVFAVWDFMSLLKALQRRLTSVELPWVPTPFPGSRRFLNEIVLGEESDVYEGRPISHFELYLEAMEQVQADTGPIRKAVRSASRGFDELRLDDAPAAAREFAEETFRLVREGPLVAIAAAFTFGREDAIPEMFRLLVRRLNHQSNGSIDLFLWYLERHIEVDGDDHGPLALKMIADVCGEDPRHWEEAAQAAEAALRARVRLWDGVLRQIAGTP